MNCPNCKNPILVNSGTCEWCGAKIGNNFVNNVSANSGNNPGNINEIPRGRKVGLIIIAIIVFIIIYLQIDPIT
jgi:hypothetical protein